MITQTLPSHCSHYKKTRIACPTCGHELEESVSYEYDYEVPVYWCEKCGKTSDPDNYYHDNNNPND